MVQPVPAIIFTLLFLFTIWRVVSPPHDSSEIKPPSASVAARGLKAYEPAAVEQHQAFESVEEYFEDDFAPLSQ